MIVFRRDGPNRVSLLPVAESFTNDMMMIIIVPTRQDNNSVLKGTFTIPLIHKRISKSCSRKTAAY